MRIKVSDIQSPYFNKEGKVSGYINSEFITYLFVKFEDCDYKVWFDISQIQFMEDIEENDGETSDSSINDEQEQTELPNN
jgi:hypothetical protein